MKKFSSALIGFILTGCMTVGHDFDIKKADQLVPGVSTEADAKALLGDPMTVESDTKGGGDVLTWKYAFASVGGGHGQGIQIAFNADGKMIKITKRSVVGSGS